MARKNLVVGAKCKNRMNINVRMQVFPEKMSPIDSCYLSLCYLTHAMPFYIAGQQHIPRKAGARLFNESKELSAGNYYDGLV